MTNRRKEIRERQIRISKGIKRKQFLLIALRTSARSLPMSLWESRPAGIPTTPSAKPTPFPHSVYSSQCVLPSVAVSVCSGRHGVHSKNRSGFVGKGETTKLMFSIVRLVSYKSLSLRILPQEGARRTEQLYPYTAGENETITSMSRIPQLKATNKTLSRCLLFQMQKQQSKTTRNMQN